MDAEVKSPMLFKFRAECVSDVFRVMFRLIESEYLKAWVPSFAMEVDRQFGEAEVTAKIVRVNPARTKVPYHIPVPLETVRKMFGEIVDCHVISQTLDYAERYTGERYHRDYGSAHLDVKTCVWRPKQK